ncbi:MAG: thioredoxin domain-containing protein, partial [Chloroflexi bacterium]|nr:thioredoxin domain-containing protein [Chloroflexota bacterium]
YYPPEPRHGMPSFRQVLESVASAYRNRKGEVSQSADQLTAQLQVQMASSPKGEDLNRLIVDDAFRGLEQQYDRLQGGFGSAPKFPQPMNLEFLLRVHHRTQYPAALAMVEKTLQKMARGGMYDQLGGGFHRYSVDSRWLVPHFEKMLYDNAQLARVYLHAYQVTRNEFYKRVVTETLDYVTREMLDPQGGFYSTQDADSEGEEGKFYVWSPQEVERVLGKDVARVFNAHYDVSSFGNFEGHSILNVPRDEVTVAKELNVSVEQLRDVIARAKPRLFAAREERVHPARDEKVLTAWNGLMLAAFAEAARVLDRTDYLATALRNADFILTNLYTLTPDPMAGEDSTGGLLRTWKAGRAKLNGYLEDYADLADGLIALYEASFEPRWLHDAQRLADVMIDRFWSDEIGGFFDTSIDHEALIMRPRDIYDSATPSGGSAAALDLLRLAVIFGDENYARRATESLRGVSGLMRRYPSGFANWLNALDFSLSHPKEIALVGASSATEMAALVQAIFRPYLPNRVVLQQDDGANALRSPLLADKLMLDGKPTVYVCQNYTCQAPVTDPHALA